MSKRRMNVHFKQLAGGNISAYLLPSLISILLGNWQFTTGNGSSFPSGQNNNTIASPRKAMSGNGIVFLNQGSSEKSVSLINHRTQLLPRGERLLYFRHHVSAHTGIISFNPHCIAETDRLIGFILQFRKMRGTEVNNMAPVIGSGANSPILLTISGAM